MLTSLSLGPKVTYYWHIVVDILDVKARYHAKCHDMGEAIVL